MATEKTTNNGWDKPIFPSDALDIELDTLFDQIDEDVGAVSLSISNNGTEVVPNTTDLNFGTDISVTDDGDETVTITLNLTQHSGDPDAHHTRYADSEAVSAVNAESSLSVDITGNADSVDGYDIQKNGTDGTGIINFKT